METKTCFRCGEAKPLSFFYKHAQMSDGRVNKCKECNKADVRKNREDNINHYREYDRKRANRQDRVEARKEYAKTDKGKEARAKGRAAWERRNPIKKAASIIVGNAVRDGRLIKPEACESCGSKPKRLHGHHDDYAFPLTVRWLCPGCHSAWHKKNGSGKNAE